MLSIGYSHPLIHSSQLSMMQPYCVMRVMHTILHLIHGKILSPTLLSGTKKLLNRGIEGSLSSLSEDEDKAQFALTYPTLFMILLNQSTTELCKVGALAEKSNRVFLSGNSRPEKKMTKRHRVDIFFDTSICFAPVVTFRMEICRSCISFPLHLSSKHLCIAKKMQKAL